MGIDLLSKDIKKIQEVAEKIIEIERMKEDIEKILKEMEWTEHEIPDPTLLSRMIRKSKET
jgi:hypothetical protein